MRIVIIYFTFVQIIQIMKDRILQFLSAESISPAEFADKIGVQRSAQGLHDALVDDIAKFFLRTES